VSLSGIMSSALSALQTNTEALRVTSNNIANLNTTGYARRVVNEQTQSYGGQLGGVDIASVERVIDQYLGKETLSAAGSSSQYDTQSSIYGQLNGILGAPGDDTALTTQLTDVSTSLGQAVLSPTDSATQLGALTSFQSLATQISSLATQIQGLRSQADQQVSSAADQANTLIKQIYQLNQQARQDTISGSTDSATFDQRDQAVASLAAIVGIRTQTQPDGTINVSTDDGTSLVGTTYAQLSYSGGSSTSGTYPPIMLTNIDPSTGKTVGSAQAFDSHVGSGSIRGLLDMRDKDLADASEQLGELARTTAVAYNTQSNANTAFPPPTSLTGSNTGLLSTDGLNFTGKTTIAVTDSSGNLVSRVDVDFDAGTMSVDGGTATSFGNTVGGFTSALNSALGSNGTASFASGELSISANSSNGIAIKDDATTPASRGGSGFSQFFGLNDLFRTATPSNLSTGLSASDTSGLAPGGEIDLALKGPDGSIVKQAKVTITAGMTTIGDVISALNTQMGGTVSFALNSDGSLSETPANPANALTVTSDSTSRGDTGMSFSALFGLGDQQAANFAAGFTVNPSVVSAPQTLAFAQLNIDATSVAGDSVVGHGDSSGALALQNVGNTAQNFMAAGGFSARSGTLGDYAASIYQGIALASQTATSNQTAQDDRLQEAQSRQSSVSGVSLDEELTNMQTYQQAYSASARVLTVVQQLYTTLLQIQ
jgi:flagellar hook-associated protein 1